MLVFNTELGSCSMLVNRKKIDLIIELIITAIKFAKTGITETKSRNMPNGINSIIAGIIMIFVSQKYTGNCPK